MKRRLFLTGDMGIGKSTAIARAIGEKLPQFGGFLTKRIRVEAGHARSFSLVSPDGSREETFLDFASGEPRLNLQIFDTLGVSLLKGDILVLDEIGGIELTCPSFMEALEGVLQRDVPILGVMKGPGPANALTKALGLEAEYTLAAGRLRQRLSEDENTLLYACMEFDENALHLAEQWVKEYCP